MSSETDLFSNESEALRRAMRDLLNQIVSCDGTAQLDTSECESLLTNEYATKAKNVTDACTSQLTGSLAASIKVRTPYDVNPTQPTEPHP